MRPEEFLVGAEEFIGAMLILSRPGEILAASQKASALLGESASSLKGQKIHGFIGEGRASLDDYLRLCIRTRNPVPGKFGFRNGEVVFNCRVDGAALRLEGGEAPQAIVLRMNKADTASGRFLLLNAKIDQLSTEVRQRKALETEIVGVLAREKAARQSAEDANRLKDEFLAILSHELRTPLNAILGWVTLLNEPDIDAETVSSGIAAIERSAHAQAEMINDLLDVSRIIAGKVRLDVQSCDLTRVVEDALNTVRPAAFAKKIRLVSTIDPNVGTVSGDPGRLQQVLWNIISNAVKFTPSEGRVHVELARVNSHIEIVVSDTGMGITADILPYVFDRFRQGDSSSTRRHGGLGLGLAISRQLVELHGGMMFAASEGKDKGSTFTVSLPYRALQSAAYGSGVLSEHPTRDDRLAYSRDGRLKGMRILVVEDHRESRQMLTRLLENFCAEVKGVESSAEALIEVELFKPDCLVSDIEMPGEDGYSLIRKIRAKEKGGIKPLPAVAVTAYARPQDRVRALEAGFQMHVPKPIEPMELMTVLSSLLALPHKSVVTND